MKKFLLVCGALVFVAIVWIVVFVIFNSLFCQDRESGASLQVARDWLVGERYVEATAVKASNVDLPDKVFEHTIGHLSGEGYVVLPDGIAPGDTAEVTLEVVQLEDGSWWAKQTVSGVEAKWRKLEGFTREKKRCPFMAGIEVASVEGSPDAGVFVSWQPLQIGIVSAGPGVAFDLDVEKVVPDWIAVEGMVSADITGGFGVGGGLGYRWFQDEGVHFSVRGHFRF